MLDKETAAKLIVEELDSLKEMLLQKNHEYGNAAFEPLGILCEPDPALFIKVRISDKLKRLEQLRKLGDATRNLVEGAASKFQEDTLLDIMGYLVLLRVWEKWSSKPERSIVITDTQGRPSCFALLRGGPLDKQKVAVVMKDDFVYSDQGRYIWATFEPPVMDWAAWVTDDARAT